ncbi:proline-specific peptidase [Myriangium duriaei CBS 260.36]|uniref:Proline-specific peptidase n=1 Tax=Myriangium duriaei CBS 260.36 TaxID=1168546 RepID=A0A9P4J3M5_9PEZI|nr:proline-specific peptidase [Myriangium duriaei CBS 260.36]
MAVNTPSDEGKIPFKIASLDKPCFTYYKVFGDLKSGQTPLVCLHGGPGGGHISLLPLTELWTRFQIPVILYDQIGCGDSTHLPHTAGDKSFWQVSLFLSELNNLLDHLHLRDGPGFHLMGRSFGGMVVADFATTRPRGLRRLIIASGSPSGELIAQAFDELKDEMPSEHQQAIAEAGRTNNFNTDDYKAAFNYLVKNNVCRSSGPLPKVLQDALKNLDTDTTVKNSVLGISPFFIDGSLREWTCIPRLNRITVPTLLQTGEFDTNGRDCAQKPFFDLIPRVRWVKFAGAGHSSHLESDELREKTIKLFGNFLTPPTFSETRQL